MNRLVQYLEMTNQPEEFAERLKKFKQKHLLSEFERLVGIVLTRQLTDKTPDKILEEYYDFFYNNRLYQHYFEYKEDYNICGEIQSLINITKKKYINILKQPLNMDDKQLDILLSTTEQGIIDIFKQNYGENV